MVERKLYAKFYATLKKYGEEEKWHKFSRVAERFYKVLFRDHSNASNESERNSLFKKMDDLIQLCELADIQKEKQEKEDNPYQTITRSMTKMQEAVLGRNWDLALAWNDLAYRIGYELYTKSSGSEQNNIAQRLAFLHSYQDLILFQQLRKNNNS